MLATTTNWLIRRAENNLLGLLRLAQGQMYRALHEKQEQQDKHVNHYSNLANQKIFHCNLLSFLSLAQGQNFGISKEN